MKHNFIIFFLFYPIISFSQHYMSLENKQIPKLKFTDLKVLKFNELQPNYNNLSESEKNFYYLVNYSRNNPTEFYDSIIYPILVLYPQLKGSYSNSLRNDLYNQSNLPLLKLNFKMITMAKEQSNDITSHNSNPSHNSTNGESFSDRFKRFDLRTCGGENISYGEDEPSFLLTLLYLDIDVPTLGHRKTLLNPNFVETGIGSSFFKNGSFFLVEDFACSQK